MDKRADEIDASGELFSAVLAETLLAAANRAGIGTTVTVRRPDGRYESVFVNEAALSINGYEREEFMARDALTILPPSEQERLLASGILPAEGVGRFEANIQHKTGELVPIEVVFATVPWADAEGGVAIVSYFTDLRERNALRDRMTRVERLLSLGTLAAGVAHEVSNPIAVTSTSLEALERLLGSDAPRSELRARALPLLADARAGTDRVTRMVGELRSVSRSDDELGAVDLAQVLASAERMARGALRDRARVVYSGEAVPEVWGNAQRLEQVFVNLLSNAAQAMPPRELDQNVIEVTTSMSGDFITVAVKDNGTGIDPDHLPRIFDPFFTTKPVGEGTGLGLSICHSIVTRLGGSMTVESCRGRGATFRVHLPRIAEKRRARTLPEPATASARATAKVRARVLVIDDEPSLVRTLVAWLGEDHDVTGVTESPEGLALLLGPNEFDLVLCDLMMPDLTGMDLYERLAAERPGAEKKLVFMTGGAFTARARYFLDRIDNPRFDKPFSPHAMDGLLAAMRRKPST